jgi:hypothetical protein
MTHKGVYAAVSCVTASRQVSWHKGVYAVVLVTGTPVLSCQNISMNLSPAEYERRAAYIQHAQAASADRRRARLRDLDLRATSIGRSTADLVELLKLELPPLGPEPEPDDYVWHRVSAVRQHMHLPFIYVRRSFIWSANPGSKPPASRLISHNGEAFRLYMILLLIEQISNERFLEFITSQRTSNRGSSWQTLTAQQYLTRRAHQVRLYRTLDRLARFQLIELPPARTRDRYRHLQVLDESGTGARYEPPVSLAERADGSHDDPNGRWRGTGSRRDLLMLPADFYTSGWVYVLTPPEIACLLMLLDMRFRYSNRSRYSRIFVPRGERLTHYGISDEVYVSHRELPEFGLLRHHEFLSGRDRGKLRPSDGTPLLPLEFVVQRENLAVNALKAVRGCLHIHPHAPHLKEHSRATELRRDRRLHTGRSVSDVAGKYRQLSLFDEPLEEIDRRLIGRDPQV